MQVDKFRYFYVDSGNLLDEKTNIFNTYLEIPDNESYEKITLLQASIPLSYYMVQTGFNTFTLQEGGSSVILTVPPGNYNINSFCVEIATLMTANSPNNYTYTANYSNSFSAVSTGKITYGVSNTINTISIIISPDNPLGEQFGFDKDSTNTFVGGVLESTNVVKFICEDTIFIHCSLVESYGTGNFSDVLQEVFNNNSIPFSNLVYTNPNPYQTSKKLATTKSKTATFTFTNEAGQPIFLNGLNVTLSLLLYKEPEYPKLVLSTLTSLLQEVKMYIENKKTERTEPADDFSKDDFDHKDNFDVIERIKNYINEPSEPAPLGGPPAGEQKIENEPI